MSETSKKMENKKFELTTDEISFRGRKLFRIKALIDFDSVRAGDFGGWIEKEENLSFDENAWVSGNAKVYGNAEVCGNAKVYGNALAYGNAVVYGNAKVCENAEYTKLYEKPDPEHIWYGKKDVPIVLEKIMKKWYKLSSQVGDVGSCVIGAGFRFELEGHKYFMSACSPYQGSISWETHSDVIKKELQSIGAINILQDWGHLD